MFKLASMFVEVGAKTAPFDNAMNKMGNQLQAKGTTLGVIAGNLATTALNTAVQSIGFAFDKTIGSASSLGEALDFANIVLGKSFGEIDSWTTELGDKFGIVKQDAIEAATSFAGLGKGLGGLSGGGLASFSKTTTQMALDMMSAQDVAFSEAAKAIQVGLSGEQSDVLKSMGVITTENTVKAYAYANGVAKAGEALTEQQKLMARLGLIQKGLADQAGNLAKTQGSAANQTRKFWGTLTNLGTEIGTTILPLYSAFIRAANSLAGGLKSGFASAKPYIAGYVDFVKTEFGYIQAVWQSLPETWNRAVDQVGQGFGMMRDWFYSLGDWVEPAMAAFAGVIGQEVGVALEWWNWFVDGVKEGVATVGVLWGNLPIVWEMVKVTFVEVVTNMVNQLAVLPANAKIFGEWFGNEWVHLLADAGNAVLTIFKNLGDNIVKIWEAIQNALAGGGFKVDWTPLLEGFKAQTAELPEFVKAEVYDATSELDRLAQKMAANGQRLNEQKAKAASAPTETVAKAAGQAAAASARANKFKSRVLDAAEYGRQLGRGQEDETRKIAEEQLDIQKKTLDVLTRMATGGVAGVPMGVFS